MCPVILNEVLISATSTQKQTNIVLSYKRTGVEENDFN